MSYCPTDQTEGRVLKDRRLSRLLNSARPMIEPGDRAPNFTLPDQDGNQVKLSGLRGQTVVLYFYPKADTPGCTTQACGVRDHAADYAAAGAVVLGVSPRPGRAAGGIRRQALARLHAALRRGPRRGRGLRGVGGEVHVRAEVHGHAAVDLRDRPEGKGHARVLEGVAQDPRRAGPGGAGVAAAGAGASRWSATPATTRATPASSAAVGIWARTTIPITVAVAGRATPSGRRWRGRAGASRAGR